MKLEIVKVDDLKERMRILAYSKFGSHYRNMSEKVLKFVKLNFKGTQVAFERGGVKQEGSVEGLQEGDTVIRIHSIPKHMNKLTHVSEKLVVELKKRGFLEFEVESIPKMSRKAEERRHEQVKTANAFVEQVKESVNVRNDATKAAEEMLDNARRGKPNADVVQGYVNSIVKNSSNEAMQAIASLKSSDQTYAHCVDCAVIYSTNYFAMMKRQGKPGVFENINMAMFGAFMHDFGKAKVPKEILESTTRFERESREMKLLQSHPVFGAELLSDMGVPSEVVNIAHYHHVKMDTSLNSSYPKNVDYAQVNYETRLASIVDVYQALIGKRSYKKSWSPASAIRYIDALAGVEFDPEVWEEFVACIGVYPKGSLVELNDGSIAFVMSVPVEDPEKPQVVVVRDSSGRDVQNHFLLDLAEVEEFHIVKDLEQYEVLGENALEYFMNIQVT